MSTLDDALGLTVSADQLTWLQMSLRATVVFIATLIIVRLGHRRFLAQLSAFDVVVGFVLASTLARAVNGSAAFFPTIGCGLVIVGLHRALAALTIWIPPLGALVKGRPDVLVEHGHLDARRLRAHGISEADVLEEARLNACVAEIAQIERATLERNGQVSVIPIGPKTA